MANREQGASTGTRTQTLTEEQEEAVPTPQQLVLRLRTSTTPGPAPTPPTPSERRVTWTPDTVDNEGLGRLKSNCCCIWVPPRHWDDPATWTPEEHETEHCRGHTLPPPPPPKKPGHEDEPGCC